MKMDTLLVANGFNVLHNKLYDDQWGFNGSVVSFGIFAFGQDCLLFTASITSGLLGGFMIATDDSTDHVLKSRPS